mgnify:CR=1 FL=1
MKFENNKINEIDLEVNKERVVHFLCQYKSDNSDTFYKSIHSAKPSFKYQYSNAKLNYCNYEHFQSYRSKANNLNEAKEELINALTKSVIDHKRYLRGKEAILLSGGLDSSCIYKIYSKTIIPLIGKMLSKSDFAYDYLPQTASKFPCREDFLEIMNSTGLLKHCRYYSLSFGIAFLYIGERK